MSLLEVRNLTQGYAEKTLYKHASFDVLAKEHVGVVGQNGAGKSTLIRILAGSETPDEGLVKWQPGVRVACMDQYAKTAEGHTIESYLHTAFAPLYAMEADMQRLYEAGALPGGEAALGRAAELQEALEAAGFYGVESEIHRVATGLGLTALGMETPLQALSGGQRAKAVLAKLLLEKADALLLDEPTNYLDKEHVAWLAGYLAAFEGAFVVVSHNPAFLQAAAASILDIEFGGIRKYHGGYAAFLQQKARLREDYQRRYTAQQRDIARTEEYIRKNIAGVNTKNARGRRTQLARMERLAPPGFAQRPSFRFGAASLPVAKALAVAGLVVGYDKPLLPALDFVVAGGEKIVVTGFNGVGKSTLLKTLVGELPALGGGFAFAPQAQTAYYAQDLAWENGSRTPLQILADAFPRMQQKEARRALARCGVKAEHVNQPVKALSGGEQSKVKLCRFLLRGGNFLILDEPTNHLDAETKEVLQKALVEFGGSVILVSHEEAFYKEWAHRVLDIGRMARG